MDEARNGAGAEGGEGQAEPPRRPRMKVLIGFLVTFLLLLVVFRGVLFPFLLAMFIAYLIEPLVAAFTRSPIFGIRWTRGPTIVFMYVLLLGGIVTASSCAVANVATEVRKLSGEVATALTDTAERARFTLVDPAEEDGALPAPPEGEETSSILIPAGTRILLRLHGATRGEAASEVEGEDGGTDGDAVLPPRVYTTLYDLVLGPEEREAAVLLRSTGEEPPTDGPPLPPGPAGRILDVEAVRYIDETPLEAVNRRIRVKPGERAVGLEVFMEKNLVTPIVENLERAGVRVQPTELREILGAQARALGENLPQRVTNWGRNVFTTLALGIYEFILILMLTAFIVMDRRKISRFFASLPPPRYGDAYHGLVRYVDRGLAGVIRGQLVICLVNGLLTYLGLLLLQVKGAIILALLAGIFSLIPIFGTILSSIPIILIATTDGIDKGLLALGWITFIHLLEANLLNPLIMGTHARMHPVIIIFALLAGEHSFGVWGALLAVPTASIIQSCFQYYRHEVEGIPREEPTQHGPDVRAMLKRVREKAAAGRRGETEAAGDDTGDTPPDRPADRETT